MRKALVLSTFFVVGLCADGYAQAPKWVLVRSTCPTPQSAAAVSSPQWSVLHSKCWPISGTAGQCAMSLRGSFPSKADCIRGNSGSAVQTHGAKDGLRDTLQCVPQSPTAEICGVSILRHFSTYAECLTANQGSLTREVPAGYMREKYRCEMSLE